MQLLKLGTISLDGMQLPEEITRREERLAALAQAREKIEVRAKERYARELAEYQAKLARREEKARTSGKKPGGKPPAPPAARPTNKGQINLTDEESRIMPTSGGGFEQAYNAQAAVDTNSMLIVAPAVTTGSRSNRCLIS